MRLLNVHTLEFRDFYGDRIPPYVVTSHRWSEQEATYKDVLKKKHTDTPGYQKVLNFCMFARQTCPDPKNPQKSIDWLWMDTCCINQNSSAEVSESINSMWRWYSEATHCIAHLHDVRSSNNNGGLEGVLYDFRKSEWFERGWTLQELLAPQCVIFVTHNWEVIGRKSAEEHSCSVAQNILHGIIAEVRNPFGVYTRPVWRISEPTYASNFKEGILAATAVLYGPFTDVIPDEFCVTAIPEDILCGFESRRNLVSREMKMAWAANRRTTKTEDMAYCLLGIFDVHMVMIYGEGERNALKRLEREIRNKEREDDLEFNIGVHEQAAPHLGRLEVNRSAEEQLSFPTADQLDMSVMSSAFVYACMCGSCKKLLVDAIQSSCGHKFCESCMPGWQEGEPILFFDPADAEGKAEGDAAVQNFGRKHLCPICGTQANLWYNAAVAQQLQASIPAYAQRIAEVKHSLGECELMTISIGNWHELVGRDAHRWTFYVRPNRTDIVNLVYIELHESFKENRENLYRRPPYTFHGRGWGYFTVFVSIILRAGYSWVCPTAENGPYGERNARLRLEWTLDFESHRGRGSRGRCSVKFKRERRSKLGERTMNGADAIGGSSHARSQDVDYSQTKAPEQDFSYLSKIL